MSSISPAFSPDAVATCGARASGCPLITENDETGITLAQYAALGVTGVGDTYRIFEMRSMTGSALIDTGTAEGAPGVDIDGAPRPVDIPLQGGAGPENAFDIGAFEIQEVPNAALRWMLYD